MLALLLKRQRKAKALLAQSQLQKETPENGEGDLSVGDHNAKSETKTARVGIEDKPWDEIQNSLKLDLEYVRTLAGSQEKSPFKVTLIEKYRALVNRLLESHQDLQGLDVIWWFYQWQIDVGLLVDVHDAFKALVLKGLNSPQGWRSNGQTAYCDIIFKYCNDAVAKKQVFNLQYLADTVTDLMAGRLATNAPLKVKLYRLSGDMLASTGNIKEALSLYNTVMRIEPKNGWP